MKLAFKILIFLTVLATGLAILGLNHAEGANRGLEFEKALDDLAAQLTDPLPSRGKIIIGVTDFWDLNGRISGLGRHAGEEMATRLFRITGRVRVIESRLLNEVVRELCFNQADLFDQAQNQRLGKFLGAEAVLVGTLTDLGESVRVNARLISTETRDSLAAGSVTIAKDTRVTKLMEVVLEPEPVLSGKCQGAVNQDKTEEKEEKFNQQSEPEKLVYENDLIRVTVKSLVRSRSGLILEIWYENLTEGNMTLLASGWGRAYATDHRGTYLLSDSGEKWLFGGDTQVGNHYGGTELVPRQRLLNRVSFSPDEGASGSAFTYVGHYRVQWRKNVREPYRNEVFQVVIRDLKPDKSENIK